MRCPMRLFVAFGFWLAFSGLALSQEVSHVPAGTSVKLPEFSVHPKWEQLFPPDHPFFVENYPDGTVQGMHARYLARLNGASATFHENGKLKSLAYYPDGVRQGGGYLWNEEQELAAYFHSKGGKVDGVVCLFKGNEPYLVQKWTDGALDKETLVSRKDGALVAVDGGDQLSPAHEALAGLMKEFTDSEKELNTHLRDSARAINEKIDEAKTHAARVTSAARMKADLAQSASRGGCSHRRRTYWLPGPQGCRRSRREYGRGLFQAGRECGDEKGPGSRVVRTPETECLGVFA